jgi:hypothetical protein
VNAPHDPARPDVTSLRATLATARAVLAADPGAAHEAAGAGSCDACTVVAAIQFGFTLTAELASGLAGHGFVSGPLRAPLLAAIDAIEAKLDSGLN